MWIETSVQCTMYSAVYQNDLKLQNYLNEHIKEFMHRMHLCKNLEHTFT